MTTRTLSPHDKGALPMTQHTDPTPSSTEVQWSLPAEAYMPRWQDLDHELRLALELAMRDAHLTTTQAQALRMSLMQQDAIRTREHDMHTRAKRASRRGLARLLNIGQ